MIRGVSTSCQMSRHTVVYTVIILTVCLSGSGTNADSRRRQRSSRKRMPWLLRSPPRSGQQLLTTTINIWELLTKQMRPFIAIDQAIAPESGHCCLHLSGQAVHQQCLGVAQEPDKCVHSCFCLLTLHRQETE